MASRQARDFGERIVHALCVERSTALEEGVLVAEVAMLRTPARHHDGVRHQIAATLDQIAAHRRQAVQRPPRCRSIDPLRTAAAKLREKLRKRLLGWAKEDSVGVRRRFVGQRGHVQPAHRDERPPGPVVVGDAIGAIGVRDIALNQDEIRPVVEVEASARARLRGSPHRLARGTPPEWPAPAGETAST